MKATFPTKAFILAAGLGKRMRPYTDTMPKPMLDVASESLIMRSIRKLHEAGVKDIAINTHYKADLLTGHVPDDVKIFYEEMLLDTGGGIKNALPFFEDEPFFVLSGDGFWTDTPQSRSLEALGNAWNPEKMDILLSLQPLETMKLTHGIGDYDLDKEGRAKRASDQTGAYMWTSMRIHHPRIFDQAPDEPFSYLRILDETEKRESLYGLIHENDWHHISTPEDLERVRLAALHGDFNE